MCKAKPKLILAEEDNIQHILASLALKVTRQSVIIAKLSSFPRKNRAKKALWELDNLRRSLHLLNYADSPQFQRNIQHALHRGESYHKLVRAVAYANGGKLRVRTDREQQLWSECSRLLANCIIYYNALHPIGIARARRAPAGLPTGRRDQASEPGKLEACKPLQGLQLPGYRRVGINPLDNTFRSGHHYAATPENLPRSCQFHRPSEDFVRFLVPQFSQFKNCPNGTVVPVKLKARQTVISHSCLSISLDLIIASVKDGVYCRFQAIRTSQCSPAMIGGSYLILKCHAPV